MPEVTGIEKIFSVWAKKRCGRFCKFGTSQFAFSWFGDEDIFWPIGELGTSVFGINKFSDIIPLSGIYRTDNVTGETKNYREPYYITRNPRKDEQQAWRQIFADAVAAWQNLTPEEKEFYNKEGKYLNLPGYQFFLKKYLLSH